MTVLQKQIARGSIVTPSQTIRTEIEFEGTIARTVILIFATAEEASAYRANPTLKHMLPFYGEGIVEDTRVTLQRLLREE